MRTTTSALATSLLCISIASAPRSQNAGQKPTFEVGTLKPNKSDPRGTFASLGCYEPNARIVVAPKGRCVAKNALLRSIIALAYDIPVQEIPNRISGPGWIASERYDMEAKAEDPDTSPANLRRMLQEFLAEQLKMDLHSEPRELAGFVLVTAKGGPKLKKASADEQRGYAGNPGKITAANTTMSTFALSLSLRLAAPIEDNTNLADGYDFALTWAVDDKDSAGPSIFTALQEQLGLRLEARKVPVNVLVINHIERPSTN